MIREAIIEIKSLLTSADLDYDVWDFTIVLVVLGESLGIVAAVLSGLPLGLAALLSVVVFLIFIFSSYAALVVLANQRIAVIEEMLPDFLSIIASNIKSGLTYDRALLVSARKEFGPLAKEVNRAAKETLSGKPLPDALIVYTSPVLVTVTFVPAVIPFTAAPAASFAPVTAPSTTAFARSATDALYA